MHDKLLWYPVSPCGLPKLSTQGEILKKSVPRWLENAIFGLFLVGQEYFKSQTFLGQTPSLNFNFYFKAVLPLHKITKIRNVWNTDFRPNGNDAKMSYCGFQYRFLVTLTIRFYAQLVIEALQIFVFFMQSTKLN